MKKSLALFVFALGVALFGFIGTASAQQYTSAQCAEIGGYFATDETTCSTGGDVRLGDYLNISCQASGVCCGPASNLGRSPSSTGCTAQTCVSSGGACLYACGTGSSPRAGSCPSGQQCCSVPSCSGTCVGSNTTTCSTFQRRSAAGSCSVPGQSCCTNETFPACTGTCRNTSCNSGESPVTGAVCANAYQVCCSAPAPVSGPGNVTGPLLSDYQLLEQIPGSSNSAGRLNTYLEDIYRFAFWTVGIAVVFMLTIGGFMYLTSAGNTSRMESAKTVIFDAILGLVLALVAWLFLYVVNPDLVNVRLPSASITPTTAPTPPATAPATPPSQATWPSDATERAALPSNVTVNRPNCTTFGQGACTSLAGTAALGAIQALSTACGNCSMTITGGTECWLHGSRDARCNGTHHRQGDYAIDLAHSTALDNYIRSAGTVICSPRGRQLYQIGNAVYWDEDSAHWHVNFNYTSCSGF